MPKDEEDYNLYQSANWTWAPNPAQRPQRYAQLGGVAFQKPQNPDFLDFTNSYLNTRAIDRRTVDPFPDMEKQMTTKKKPRKQKKKRVKKIPVEQNELPKNANLSDDYITQMGGMMKDVSSNLKCKKGFIPSISDALYCQKRPQYFGFTLLIFVVILLCIALFSKK